MARTIVTYCDLCLTTDEQTPAQTFEVSTRLPGTRKGVAAEVDLCEEHGKIIVQLADLLTEHGRAAEQQSMHVCPECGHTSPTKSALQKHTRTAHGLSLTSMMRESQPASSESSGTAHVCDICGKSFATPQGRGAHAARSHGVRTGKAKKSSRT